VDVGQRHHVLALEALPCTHACLVGLLQSSLVEVLDQRDEYVFGVVFLKSNVRIGVVLTGIDLFLLRGPGSVLAGVGVEIEVYLFAIRLHTMVT